MFNEVDRQRFGAFVSQLRQEKGWTQKQLAALLHISDKAVSKWETGVSIPDTALLPALAEALGVTVDELLAGNRSASTPSEPPTPEEEFRALPRTTGEFGSWQITYLLSAGLTLFAFLLERLLNFPISATLVYRLLPLCFGIYFCFFALLRLPSVYDRQPLSLFYDYGVRLNLAGLRLNNHNWPHILKSIRLWCLLTPPLCSLLSFALHLFPAIEHLAGGLICLGGLFGCIYGTGWKYR